MSEIADARVLKTKARLIKALSDLTRTKPLDEISVSEISHALSAGKQPSAEKLAAELERYIQAVLQS